MHKQQKYFPNNSENTISRSFSEGDLNGILLDGMKVIFDKKVTASPVSLDYKKKRKVIGQTR